MQFKYLIPTAIYFEKHCIENQSEVLASIGEKAMIVTGKYSAKACGALIDVINALVKHSKEYIIFDEIENNPSVETVERASQIAKLNKVDYIIGIGGGSPIDAAKAIAVLTANPEMGGIDLFQNTFTKVLPIVGIPTTAGTGSEVTPYSVLVRQDMQTKMSFGTVKTFPSYAFLDARYTISLSSSATINTAVDALTHVMEGYLANRSTSITDALALEALGVFRRSIEALVKNDLSLEDRENLMYISLLGGMIIAQTGVTLAHGMGYCYTFFKDIPHGKANGLIMKEYLKYLYEVSSNKMEQLLKVLEYSNVNQLIDLFTELLGNAPQLTKEDVTRYTELTKLQKGSINNTPGLVDEKVIKELWEKMS